MTMLRLLTAPRPARGGRGELLRRLLAAAFGVCAVADLVCEVAGWDTVSASVSPRKPVVGASEARRCICVSKPKAAV